MTQTRGTTYIVSRLRWNETESVLPDGTHVFELPHVRGVPIPPEPLPKGTRIREWPNICGQLESGEPDDLVMWRSDLAPEPDTGVVHGVQQRPASVDVEGRTAALRELVKSLEQLKGVRQACPSVSATCVMLTSGVPDDDIREIERQFPGAIAAVPTRLAEFPGAIHLAYVDSAWHRRREYAEAIKQLLVKGV